MMTLPDLIENFQIFDDWEERYSYLLDLANRMPHMDEGLKTPQTKVNGCVSQVWLVKEVMPDGSVKLHMDSDAHIVRGLAAVLYVVFKDKKADELAAVDVEGIFADIGLLEHLSPNRRNGFVAMVQRIKG